ncbi:hypothetical protein BH23GEM11_BH23GEM11_10010 [soil metagenome]
MSDATVAWLLPTLVGVALVLAAGVVVLALRLRGAESRSGGGETEAALQREIETRREIQRTAEETEARLADFLEHAHDLIHSADPEGRILYVNEAWKRRLGYTDDEVASLRIRDIVHPDNHEEFDEATRKIFAGTPVSGIVLTFMARDGSPVLVSGSSNCRFVDGVPVATRTILRDLTTERNREEALAHVEANLVAVFESTGDPIWSVDREGRLLTFNSAFAEVLESITGSPPKVGDLASKLMSAEASAWFDRAYARALDGDRFSDAREERLEGRHRIFEMFFHPIETSGGGISGVVVFARDATRRHLAEDELRRARHEAEAASATKSHFLASMSHELRTPLNSIIGFSNLLLRGPAAALGERDRGFLERIQVNGKHLLALINEILDLSRIESGRMELHVEPVALAPLIEETVGQLEAQVEGRPIRLRWEVVGSTEPQPLETDPSRLRQVLINLVGNALKFTESGEVCVRLETEGDSGRPLRIRVRDTGIGIPEDRLDAIFGAFEQAESGTSRRFGGTGLGLAISRSLSTLMGFDLTVASAVGRGSEFTLALVAEAASAASSPEPAGHPMLPASSSGAGDPGGLEGAVPPRGRWDPSGLSTHRGDEAVAGAGGATGGGTGNQAGQGGAPAGVEAADPDGAEVALQGKTVLVVDDEEDSRTLLRVALEDLGCRVLLARDGAEGLEVARSEGPDLITLDLMMPGMSGWEMLRGLRDDPRIRNIPVVVVSLVADESGRPTLGAVDLLPKPFDREDLLPVLRRNLARSGSRILVVDPHPASRLLVTRYLRDAGFVVHAVEDGEHALQYLKRVPVELVLTDLDMPDMDGAALLARLRETPAFAEVPVVVLSERELTPEEARQLESALVQIVRKASEVEANLVRALDSVFRKDRVDQG